MVAAWSRGRGAPLREVQYETCSFAVDVLACHNCQGRMKLLAMVKEPASIVRYLATAGEPTEVPSRSPGRGPPYMEEPRAQATGAR